MTEVWKDVKGFEGLYEISNFGRCKSKKRKTKTISIFKDRLLTPKLSQNGYLRYGLSKNGVVKSHLIHRLVAIHFIDNTENKPQINHINGIKTDNMVENLEWATSSENLLHKFNKLNYKQHNRLLDDNQVIEIIEYLKNYKRGMVVWLAKKYNVPRNTICVIKSGKKYKLNYTIS